MVSELDALKEADQRRMELSAAMGWPGGLSQGALDWAELLQRVARMRVGVQSIIDHHDSLSRQHAGDYDKAVYHQSRRNVALALLAYDAKA